MKVWKQIENFKAKNPAITIGSFDGVHLGHHKVLDELKKVAQEQNGESVVFTFHPHPIEVLKPDADLVMLTTIEEKIQLFDEAGVDHLVLFPFSKEIAALSYRDFVQQLLLDKLGMNTLLIGYDNHIGKNREGNFEKLQALGKEWNFKTLLLDVLTNGEERLSSTAIRELLTNGKILEASKLLGYPYLLSGTVVHGKQLGNKLGFPTANILPPKGKFIPANGVYAITAEVNESTYKGMMNIGLRPTVEDGETVPVIEAHLFDMQQDLYGKYLKIHVYRKLRNEFKFDSVEALRQQLKKDKEFALETLELEFSIK